MLEEMSKEDILRRLDNYNLPGLSFIHSKIRKNIWQTRNSSLAQAKWQVGRGDRLVLKAGLEKTGRFNIVSKDNGVPLVAFSLKNNSCHDEFEVSDYLRRFGWIVPAYTMPPDAQNVTVLRVVIREDFSRTLAERLVIDIQKVLHELDTLPAKITAKIALNGENADKNVTVVTKKSAIETQREITTVWRKFVMEKKKMNGVC
nr:glutamate decarboxylase 1 [Quercus suber]